MIKVEEEIVQIKGSKIKIIAELTTLLHCVISDRILSEDEYDYAMEHAKLDKEEIDSKISDSLDRLFNEKEGK